jgi:hypothetical protein
VRHCRGKVTLAPLFFVNRIRLTPMTLALHRSRVLVTACFAASLIIVRLAVAGDPDATPNRFAATIWTFDRGSAYAVELQGQTLRYTRDATTRRIAPTQQQWRAFRRALDDVNVWRWRADYDASVTDGTSWSLKIEYADHTLDTKGHNAYPDHTGSPSRMLPTRSFTRYLLAVQTLLGDRPFSRRVGPLEFFDLAELQLVATHPSRNKRAQWADFRDPTGNIHRAVCGTRVGSQFGVLTEVNSASVSLKEVFTDAGGDWEERDTIVKKAGAP